MECISVRFYEMDDISTTTSYMHFILLSSDIYNKLHKSSAASNPQTQSHQPQRTTKVVSFHLWGTWIPISFLWNTRMPANFDLILNHNQIKIYLKSRKVCVIFTIIVIQSRSLVEVGNCELLHTTILRISDLYFLFFWSLKKFTIAKDPIRSMYRACFIIDVLHNVIRSTCNESFCNPYKIGYRRFKEIVVEKLRLGYPPPPLERCGLKSGFILSGSGGCPTPTLSGSWGCTPPPTISGSVCVFRKEDYIYRANLYNGLCTLSKHI